MINVRGLHAICKPRDVHLIVATNIVHGVCALNMLNVLRLTVVIYFERIRIFGLTNEEDEQLIPDA